MTYSMILKLFVKDFGLIYGLEFVGYNVHSLIHIALDARNFGPLDSISCFPFETFLGKLKNVLPETPKSCAANCQAHPWEAEFGKTEENIHFLSP